MGNTTVKTPSAPPTGNGTVPPPTEKPAEKPVDKPAPSAGSNPLGLNWVGGSSGTAPVAKPDPEAQRLAQLKTDLLSPLTGVPGPAQTANWKQNDLLNRANLIKSIRSDAALQTAFSEWDTLPMDLKLSAGKRLAALEGAIYGFQPATIQLDAFLKKPAYGYYHPVEDKVHVSPDVLADLREFVNTVTHEQAHAYQWEKAADAKAGRMDQADPLYATAMSWYENYFDYAQPSAGYQVYRAQPIEAHAFATGDGVTAGVFS